MAINYSIKPFQVLIGDLDITDCLTKFEIGRPIPEMGEFLTWNGSFSYFFNPESATVTTESQLDPITNPSYFRPYQRVCTFRIEGITVCLFYIERCIYNSLTGEGEASIYQLIDIAKGDSPSVEVPITLSLSGESVANIILNCINSAFIGTIFSPPTSVFDTTKHSELFYSRLTATDLIQTAAEFAFKNYYWLYLDTLNRVNQVSGNPELSSNLIIRSAKEVELEPIFDNINFAASQVIVTGTFEYPPAIFNLNSKPSLIAALSTSEDGIENFTEDGKRLRLITKVYKKKYEVYPEIYAVPTEVDKVLTLTPLDNGEILFEEKIVEYKYWGINPPYHVIEVPSNSDTALYPQVSSFADKFQKGDLVQTITTTKRIRGGTYNIIKENINSSPGITIYSYERIEDNTLITVEKLIETDWCKIQYQPKKLVDLLATQGNTDLRYDPASNILLEDQLIVTNNEVVRSGRVDPDGSIPEKEDLKLEDEVRPEDRPEEPELKLEEVPVRGTAYFDPVGWNPFRKKPYTVEVGWLSSADQANYLALQLGKREIRRRDAVSVVMPVPMEYIQSGCIPLQKARIHNLELLITEEIISIEDGQMKFAFTGERIGLINPILSTPDPVPYLPNQLIYLINQNHTILQGNLILTQLEVIGGNPPYSFSSVTLPTGLTLSNTGILSGTPTINGSSSHLINITDTLANQLQINLNFVIVPNTPSTALDLVRSELENLLKYDIESLFVFSLDTNTIIDLISYTFDPLLLTIGINTDVQIITTVFLNLESSVLNPIVQNITPLQLTSLTDSSLQTVTPLQLTALTDSSSQTVTPLQLISTTNSVAE